MSPQNCGEIMRPEAWDSTLRPPAQKVWAYMVVASGLVYFMTLALMLQKYSHLFRPEGDSKVTGRAHTRAPGGKQKVTTSLVITHYENLWNKTTLEGGPYWAPVTSVGAAGVEDGASATAEGEEDRLKESAATEEEFGDAPETLVPEDINIEVSVAKWSLLIKVDGREVLQETMQVSDVKQMLKGGLYLTVLHPATAALMHASRHRTFEVSGDEALWRVLQGVQPGRIVVLAAMHESFMQVSEEVVASVRRCGSRVVADMTTGDRWAWIWTKGGRTWAEGAVFSTSRDSFVQQGGPLHLHAHLPRAPLPVTVCETWPRGREWDERREFCRRYEGYGDLCSCDAPRHLPRQPPAAKVTAAAADVPTVVVASQRPLSLDRCLRRLMSVAGSEPRLTLVVADGDPDGGLREVSALVSLYGMKFLGHDAGGNNVTLRITRHYKVVLDAAFTTFPEADMVILLEEDLYVAADFYRYFAQTAPLLDRDPTLYCISAWNDLSQAGMGGDPAVVMRSETMAGLGWLLSRRIYQEIIPKWPAYEKFTDWDMWMRLPAQQRGRECLVPEVSRTFHFGITGAHLTAYFQSTYYAHTAFNTRPDVRLRDLHRLGPETYDTLLRELLEASHHLNGTNVDPCSRDFLPRNSNTHYTLWIKMNEESDDYTFLGVMSCLRLWNLDVRGHHKLVWRLRWRGSPLLLVGWPASPFSLMKPRAVQVVRRYDPRAGSRDPPVYQYLPSNTTTYH